MQRTALVTLFLAFIFSVSGQINVYHIDQNAIPQGKEGLFYSLPRTTIKIEVTIDKIENYRGPYSDYAMKYLGLKNVVTANAVEYSISDMKVLTSPQPDPDQYYFVELGDKLSKSEKENLLSFTESGLILGTISQDVDTVVRIMNSQGNETISEMDVFPEIFKYSADVSFVEKVDTIVKKVNIDTITVERSYLKRTVVEKPVEQKAKEAADFISKIKDNRFNLISGFQEVNYNKESLEYMDAQLKQLEKEYMKLFTGISIHKTFTYTYVYTPNPNQINTELPIFKIHKTKGVIDLDGQGGKVVSIKIQRSGTTAAVSSFIKKDENRKKTSGFYYRIPELAKVTVKAGEDLQKETQCLISQLGVVSSLPVSKWKVGFYKETGAIKNIDL